MNILHLLGFVAVIVSTARAAQKQPNVLFLFSDDQRADTIAALGNAHIRTPALDRLVQSGTTFTQAYCMGSNQGAVCVPSRAMLMSGRTLFRVQEQLKGQTTWPEMFARAGYSTFATGKWHNGPESLLRSFQQGRHLFLGGMGDPYKLAVQDMTPEHKLSGKQPGSEHSIKLFADAAVEFLQGRKEGAGPFLCYVAFNAPHDPRVAPKSWHERFKDDKPPLPPDFLPQHPFDNGAMMLRDEELAPWPRTPEIVREHLADYYAAIEHMDAQIGRVLEALKASGEYDNTIVVFSSDHGLAIGSHGLFGKQNLYDHSMHSPLIMSGPGIPAGQRSAALCYLLDIFPTLGELTGVSAPEGSEGRTLGPVLRGQTDKLRLALLTSYTQVQRAVRDDRWKLIAYPRINRMQLFDLSSDPHELKDLSADPAHAADRTHMTELLAKLQAEAGDTQPLTSAAPEPEAFDFSQAKRSAGAKAE